MKKPLFGLAVLGALWGATSAQSSVTMFGVLDVNARYVDNDSVSQYSMSQDGLQSSRLGVRGIEIVFRRPHRVCRQAVQGGGGVRQDPSL